MDLLNIGEWQGLSYPKESEMFCDICGRDIPDPCGGSFRDYSFSPRWVFDLTPEQADSFDTLCGDEHAVSICNTCLPDPKTTSVEKFLEQFRDQEAEILERMRQEALAALDRLSQPSPEQTVTVRRQWNHWEKAQYRLEDLEGVHWSKMSGGVRAVAPRHFLHAYVQCDGAVSGEIPHSGRHGPCPHRIKVVIVKKDNKPEVFRQLLVQAGERPDA